MATNATKYSVAVFTRPWGVYTSYCGHSLSQGITHAQNALAILKLVKASAIVQCKINGVPASTIQVTDGIYQPDRLFPFPTPKGRSQCSD